VLASGWSLRWERSGRWVALLTGGYAALYSCWACCDRAGRAPAGALVAVILAMHVLIASARAFTSRNMGYMSALFGRRFAPYSDSSSCRAGWPVPLAACYGAAPAPGPCL